MIRCPRCKTEKEIKYFSVVLSRCNGHDCYCKKCRSEMRKEYFNKYPEKRKQYWIYGDEHKIYMRIWNLSHKDKSKTYGIVNRNRKKLIKKNCEMCDSKNNLQLHHPDYNKPMYVITLCKDCHWQIHTLDRQINY